MGKYKITLCGGKYPFTCECDKLGEVRECLREVSIWAPDVDMSVVDDIVSFLRDSANARSVHRCGNFTYSAEIGDPAKLAGWKVADEHAGKNAGNGRKDDE